MPNYFTVPGLAPTHDPTWAAAPVATRATFLRAARVIVLTEWDRQTSEGLDRHGNPFAPLKASTIKHRRSAMGPADPHAPALQPAHELSRTRSLVDAQVVGASVRVFWKFDPVTGRRWGTILNYHRKGAGHLPVRDVFGLSPDSYRRARAAAHLWWAGYSRGLPVVMPARPRPGKAARSPAAQQPAYVPKAPPPRPLPSKAADVAIGGDIFTMSKGQAAELLGAMKRGQFTGFRSYAGAAAPSPPPTPIPAPRPGPAPSRATVAYAEKGWESVARRVLGRPVAAEELVALSGAPEGRASITDDGQGVHVRVVSGRFEMVRVLKADAKGEPYLHAAQFYVEPGDRGKGLGADVFGRMVDAARGAGLSRIATHAARGADENGYYTWARFGYDGPIPERLRLRLPAALAGASRVSDLMMTPGGSEWWRTNGDSVDLTFDLTPGSLSLRLWEAYRRARAARGG